MSDALTRRSTLTGLVATAGAACVDRRAAKEPKPMTNPIRTVKPLSFPWQTPDPFLFCVHHDDAYPKGNAQMGPAASLAGRVMGQDFEGKDGWRMYHGEIVPGFPQHPHRGFETVTVVRRGLLDHSDSLGAAARYGQGDVQWLTAGKGILHSEMFPLLSQEKENPVELFQIWLNLPRADKFAAPHFTMLWAPTVPKHVAPGVEVTMVAGALEGKTPPQPPPSSWASRADTDVAIWTLKLAPGARWTLPAAKAGSNRNLYFFKGSALTLAGTQVPPKHVVELVADQPVELAAGADEVELLMLQGRPIKEPVVNYGPFVMTTPEEIRQTLVEYQQTQFGGWPWPSHEPVHAREEGRFAKRPDGTLERPA